MGGVKAILMSQRSVNPWWILESAAEKKVGIQKSFRRVIQALEEVDRFVKESMPDDSQLNAECNRAEKRASKMHVMIYQLQYPAPISPSVSSSMTIYQILWRK